MYGLASKQSFLHGCQAANGVYNALTSSLVTLRVVVEFIVSTWYVTASNHGWAHQ